MSDDNDIPLDDDDIADLYDDSEYFALDLPRSTGRCECCGRFRPLPPGSVRMEREARSLTLEEMGSIYRADAYALIDAAVDFFYYGAPDPDLDSDEDRERRFALLNALTHAASRIGVSQAIIDDIENELDEMPPLEETP